MPDFAFASATSSCTDFTGTSAGTTMKNGSLDTNPTGTKSRCALIGALAPISIGVTTIVEAAHTNSVYPSGADLATASAPIMVVPPGRASITKLCPSAFDHAFATSRAAFSAPAPGGNGMTTRTGLFGYGACAATVPVKRANANIAAYIDDVASRNRMRAPFETCLLLCIMTVFSAFFAFFFVSSEMLDQSSSPE